MEETLEEILEKYWKHKSFRPLQKEIIQSVLNGDDTLALLPTGGGKSICFQLPAMAKDGICIVVTPLIALMKDQVYQLVKRGIPATAIFSGMYPREIEIQLNKCVFGNIKFLYVSPERLKNELFIERFKSMKVNLIAVDEAHCISQWGYDFRPQYLEIAEIRKHHQVPIIALTATATKPVVEDIQLKLNFKKNNLIQSSFARKNLSYNLVFEENKLNKIVEIFNRIPGSGLVYLRNRAKTKEVAEYLSQHHISTDFYHAGLSNDERQKKQEKWTRGQTRVMACTNAFGMGIDKSDVRVVIHLGIPENIESYFQEAGRAGRDEQNAYAVLLYSNRDLEYLKDRMSHFPTTEMIKNTYQQLFTHYQILYGEGKNETHIFNLASFIEKNNLELNSTIKAIELIEQFGLIFRSEAFYKPSKLMVMVSNADLYKYQIENPQVESLIKIILRTYTGIFDGFVKIDESIIAKKLNAQKNQIVNALHYINKSGVMHYIEQSDEPTLTFLENRYTNSELTLDYKFIEQRRKVHIHQIESISELINIKNICRTKQLLKYFGEDWEHQCGICDICRKKIKPNIENFKEIKNQISNTLKDQSLNISEIIDLMPQFKRNDLTITIDWMIENEEIIREEGNFLTLPKIN